MKIVEPGVNHHISPNPFNIPIGTVFSGLLDYYGTRSRGVFIKTTGHIIRLDNGALYPCGPNTAPTLFDYIAWPNAVLYVEPPK